MIMCELAKETTSTPQVYSSYFIMSLWLFSSAQILVVEEKGLHHILEPFTAQEYFSFNSRTVKREDMTKIVEFKVGMTCGGCSGAVTRILGKIEGVSNIDANIEAKLVKVTCEDSVENQVMLDALLKWAEASKKEVQLIN